MCSIVKEKSLKFAVRIVKMYQFLINDKKEHILSKQLVRAGTSIGANIHEAYQGSSKKDFINKLTISLKESNETEYWLILLKETGYLSETQFDSIYLENVEIIKLLTSIIKTSKKNLLEN